MLTWAQSLQLATDRIHHESCELRIALVPLPRRADVLWEYFKLKQAGQGASLWRTDLDVRHLQWQVASPQWTRNCRLTYACRAWASFQASQAKGS